MIDEVEALIKTKTRNKVRIHHLEGRVGDSVAFLSYFIDDKNQTTIWQTEVPPSLQHMGIEGKLVEEAVQLISRDSFRLLFRMPVCEGISYDLAEDRYSNYAVGSSATLFDISGKYAHADCYVWSHMSKTWRSRGRRGPISSGDSTQDAVQRHLSGPWLIGRAYSIFAGIVGCGFDLSDAQIQQRRNRCCLLAAEPGVYL